jgi:solute:Na+ symporter, SSS family
MFWIIFWIVIYLSMLLFISLRHVKSTDMEQYMVNNRNTALFPLVATTAATFIGGGASFGLMATGYEGGFAAIWIGIAHIIGFVIIAQFASKIRDFGAEHKIYSLPHYLNFVFRDPDNPRFNAYFSKSISGVNIFIFFFMVATQFVAMATLLKFSFEIGFNLAAAISAGVIILYTALAGLSGVIITDMAQFITIVLMTIIILIPGIWVDTEGLSRLSELPAEMLNGTKYGIIFLIGLPVFFSWSVLVRMDIWQRILAARTGKIAKRMTIWTGFVMLPFYIVFPMVGMTILLHNGTGILPEEVAHLFLMKHTNDFMMGFAIVGLLSALMSSGDSFLNIIAISSVKDFVKGTQKGPMSQKDYKWIKIMAVIFGVIALVMALIFPKVVDMMVLALSTITLFVPITLLALTNKNAGKYRKPAWWSLLSGFVVNIAFFIYGLLMPEHFEAKSSFVPGVIVATLVLLAGIMYVKKNHVEALKTNA